MEAEGSFEQRKDWNKRKSMVTWAVTPLGALKQTIASTKVLRKLMKVAPPIECGMTRLLDCR